MGKQATIYDVARRSGFSVATVSRVLGDSGYPVRKQTREKVLAAAAALHYTPNAMGKSLKTHQSRDIGVILPTITNPSYAMLLEGVQREAAGQGYHILLSNTHRDPAHEAKNLRVLMEKRVAGILLTSIAPDLDALEGVLAAGFPLITMEQALPISCVHVGYDYEAAGRMMAAYLVQRGHRRIGLIGAPLDRPSRRLLLWGCRQALEAAGCPMREEDILLSATEAEGDSLFEIENGLAGAALFLGRAERPTGYLCINDLTALGAIQGFARGGLSVPGDVSVIGFDNIPYAALGVPTLTTVDQCALEMGGIATRLLIDQIEHKQAVTYAVTLTPRLIERDSVGSA